MEVSASRALAGGAGIAGELQRQHHVLEGGQRWHEVKGLEDEADALAAQPRAAVLVERRQVLAAQPHLASGGLIEPGEQREQRRLARAGGADQRHALAGADLEVYVVEDGQRPFGADNLLAESRRAQNNPIHLAFLHRQACRPDPGGRLAAGARLGPGANVAGGRR